MPVVSIDGKTIGNGRPGAITMRLYEALASRLADAANAAPAPAIAR
jgi:hypothetical protein